MGKIFTLLRSFTDDHHTGKTKFCATCGSVASQEAIFNVGNGFDMDLNYLYLLLRIRVSLGIN
jgi:hypothetical protein